MARNGRYVIAVTGNADWSTAADFAEQLLFRLMPTPAVPDRHGYYSHRLLVSIMLLTAAFALVYVTVSHIIGFGIGERLMLACFILSFVILAIFRATSRFRLCANLYLANCFFVAIIGCSFYSGGIRSMVVPWFSLVPLASVLLFEFGTDTKVWVVLSCVVVLAFGLAGMRGFPFPMQYEAGFVDFFNMVCVVGLTIMLALVALVFGRNRSRAEADLLDAMQIAEKANAAKSRFLASASHDLRQPIHAINLFNDALRVTRLNDEQKKITEYLSRASRNLGDLLDSLLEVSRFDLGAVASRSNPIQGDSLRTRIESTYAQVAAAKGLRFKVRLPRGNPMIVTDMVLLQRLLGNLIDNAIKYTDRGGILVGMRRRGAHMLVQVWDSGAGIAPEHTQAVFDEYFQVANPERDHAKGLGLGLAIVKRLAQLLDTSVICRSRQHRGSVFEFRVPLARLEEPTASIPLHAIPAGIQE